MRTFKGYHQRVAPQPDQMEVVLHPVSAPPRGRLKGAGAWSLLTMRWIEDSAKAPKGPGGAHARALEEL
ncbi:unnamed protein product [Arctogadus glacialis]